MCLPMLEFGHSLKYKIRIMQALFFTTLPFLRSDLYQRWSREQQGVSLSNAKDGNTHCVHSSFVVFGWGEKTWQICCVGNSYIIVSCVEKRFMSHNIYLYINKYIKKKYTYLYIYISIYTSLEKRFENDYLVHVERMKFVILGRVE